MGILPLQFETGSYPEDLNLDGSEIYDFDLNDLKIYEISRDTYSFQENQNLQKSYEIWKKLVDKFFLSNQ